MPKSDISISRKPEVADISTTLCGIPMKSPFILSSGPLGSDADALIKAYNAGCGAVVTKTIRAQKAVNPLNHIAAFGSKSLLNCEKWSDLPREQWIKVEIPKAKAAGVVVIASVGHTKVEAKETVKEVEKAGADMIELVSYSKDDILPMLKITKELVDIPVICKLSANWSDVAGLAQELTRGGADGLCAIDSIGPTLRIDINRAAPVLGGEGGAGWMSGEAIRPVSLHVNADISRRLPDFRNLYGCGGCMSAADAIEFLMCGCAGVGLCTYGILNGIDAVTGLCNDLSETLCQLGYHDIESVRGAAIKNLPKEDIQGKIKFKFKPFPDKDLGFKGCIRCNRCGVVCSYGARRLEYPEMTVDERLCRGCGVCADICPTGALKAE
ncbi:MAG: 4Fe-4S dicluster domain-containing protein [Lachnospiraceae bacterium]|jgi:dihydroorotate dehydrogenase (fumarate)|nr:4Fe-4S dicluster domain-containing protein [Lachnospiraceae bacterium]